MDALLENNDLSDAVRRGRRLANLTIVWNSLEGILSVGAGILAGSIALVGFGIDSVIEVSSGGKGTGRGQAGDHAISMKTMGPHEVGGPLSSEPRESSGTFRRRVT